MTLEEKARQASGGKFLGVPFEGFDAAGREQLAYLLRAGLTPTSKVLDLGCGVLRAGYWLIHFLDPGCYCGIEPHAERLGIGRDAILEPETLRLKRPRFDPNPAFDSSVFGEKFDFFLAYSIWTHAPRTQIAAMLDAFLRDSTETAVFLTTYLPPTLKHRAYAGEQWVGTSHESEEAGCIRHSYRTLAALGQSKGLRVRRIGQDEQGQFWLEIMRASAPARVRVRRIPALARRALYYLLGVI